MLKKIIAAAIFMSLVAIGGCSGEKSVCDKSTGLCWQHPGPKECVNWTEAKDYCESLGGNHEWRLPRRQDFINMVGGCDSNVMRESSLGGWCNSCARSDNCSALFGSDSRHYWSSSRSGSERAWRFDFKHGQMENDYILGDSSIKLSVNLAYIVSGSGYVRCVRAGP